MDIASKITQFRKNLRITKSGLARMLDLSPAMITNYENGKKQPSLKTVIKLSEVLMVPLEYFVTDKEYNFQVACRNMATKDNDQVKEIFEFCKLADNYQNLMIMSDIKMEFDGPKEFLNQELTDQEISNIKTQLDLPDIVDFQSLSEAVEKVWKIPVFKLPFKSRKLSGLTIKRQNEYYIFINHGHSEGRRLFSLAHEIGHILMHMGDDDFSSQFSPRSKPEKQANKFAESFSIPKEEFDRKINVEGFSLSSQRIRELADDFNVSYDCMVHNLYNLDMINYGDPRSKSPEPKQIEYDDSWEIFNFPAQYILLTYKAWADGKISISKAADYLCTDSSDAMFHFRLIADVVSGIEGDNDGTDS